MKKNLLSTILSFVFISTFSQVGINTANPQQLFHIDGASSTDTKNPVTGTPSTLQQSDDFVITKSGSVGIGTINPQGKLDVSSTVSTFVPPRLSAEQRNAIPPGKRPTGVMVFNTDLSRLQINIGTDDEPMWESLDLTNTTANRAVLFKKHNIQQVNFPNNDLVTFDTVLFNNTPEGYITQQPDQASVVLAKGKTYKIEVIMGKLLSSDTNGTICRLYNNNTAISLTRIFPKNITANAFYNTFNTMTAFLTTTTATATVQIKCTKLNAGNVTIYDEDAPVLSITITN